MSYFELNKNVTWRQKKNSMLSTSNAKWFNIIMDEGQFLLKKGYFYKQP